MNTKITMSRFQFTVWALMTIALTSCATTPSMDRQGELSRIAAELNIKESGIKFISQCHYANVLKGVSQTHFSGGVCAYTATKQLHIRSFDYATAKSSAQHIYETSLFENGSIRTALLSQLQLRQAKTVLVIQLLSDGFPQNAQTAELLKMMVADGLTQIDSLASISLVPRRSIPATPAYLPPPKK